MNSKRLLLSWKWKGEKDISCKQQQKREGITILISDKIDFKPKKIIRDKKGHCILIKVQYSKKI